MHGAPEMNFPNKNFEGSLRTRLILQRLQEYIASNQAQKKGGWKGLHVHACTKIPKKKLG